MFVSFKSDITGAAGGAGQLSVSRVTDFILCLVEDVRLAQSLVLRTIGFFYLSLSRLAIIVCVCPSMKFMFLGYFIPFKNRVAVVLLYIVFNK